jgi:hypothetical protein
VTWHYTEGWVPVDDSVQWGRSYGLDSAAAEATVPGNWYDAIRPRDTLRIPLAGAIVFDTT